MNVISVGMWNTITTPAAIATVQSAKAQPD